MAVPTVASITPNVGPSQGWTLVVIEGTGFNTPPVQTNPYGALPAPPETVRVLFGTEQAREVHVVSATKLYVVTPAVLGVVTVTVMNVDAETGIPIVGEAVEVIEGFEFKRPSLTVDNIIPRIAAELTRMLREQVHPNVMFERTTPDWSSSDDQASGRVTKTKLPALVLSYASMVTNSMYTQQGNWSLTSGNTFKRRKRGYCHDLVFDLEAITATGREQDNLKALLALFFRNNVYLRIWRDPSNTSKGKQVYELRGWMSSIIDATVPNLNGVSSCRASFSVIAVEIESIAGFADDGTIGVGETAQDLELETDEIPSE